MSANAIEQLESRICMDGNVQAAIIDGDLVVRGDAEDNNIIIQRIAGRIRVTGLEGTRVNGVNSREFAPGFDDLEILMRQGGEDAVLVHGGIKINGDLSAQMGDTGSLAVEGTAGLAEIGGNLLARGGEECNIEVRNEVLIRGRADIETGGDASLAAAEAMVPNFAGATFSNSLKGDNPYMPRVVGTRYTYEETSFDDETGERSTETSVVEVTNQTKTMLGVVTRVVRDRVFDEDGLLIEDTRDWFAQDDNGNVWYFGEQSTDFEYDDEGNLVSTSTETSWIAGVNGARPGIAMLARPNIGSRYYQEFAPGDALDYGQVLGRNESLRVLGRTYNNVLRTQDKNLRSPDEVEHKFYAPGLGMVQEFGFNPASGEVEATLRLTSVTRNGQPVTQLVSPTLKGTNPGGRITGPVRVFGETLIEAGGAVVVQGGRFADEVEINGESEVLVLISQLEDLTVNAEDDVALRNVTASQEVEISGDVDVFVFASRFNDRVAITLGEDDNELAVRSSTFQELFADGGDGEDEFDDRGGNDFGELDLQNFEET
jgi:hypothetical protein